VGWCIADLILHSESPEQDIVVELKATTYAPRSSEKAQLLGYLRALDLPTGYLINFPQPTSSRDVSEVDFIEMFKGQSVNNHCVEEEKTPTITLKV
jgi:hypothetical protein